MRENILRPGKCTSAISAIVVKYLAPALLVAVCGITALASPQAQPATSSQPATQTAMKLKTQAKPAMKSAGMVVIDSKVTILESADAAGPIQKATEDLRNDFQKVLGAKPRMVTSDADSGPVTIMIGEQSELPEAARPAGLTDPESFSISVMKADATAKTPTTVLLTGADMRGTIYAIYQFSQEYLGVDPMYYWTDLEPARRASISIPASLQHVYPAPLFKYRGFFLNDEDMLTGWAPGEKTDGSGISLAVMNKVYETILRLKGNMVVPGTWIFPNDPQVKLVGERGLILTQHHAIPLGVNVARWPADQPYNYTTHPEILERAWKDAVNEYDPHQEILWAVGLRGLSDSSYASMDPSVVGNDKALGHLINKAIDEQMKTVRAVRPDAKFVTDFWQEGARLVQEGDLSIPKDAIPVWADTGYGDPQDKGQVAAGQGIYYHVAMLNGSANQLSEMVPVDRIDTELGRYIKAGATAYMLLNTSDIRAVSMTTEAVMDISWGGIPAGATDDQYYRQWATKEFGAKSAAAVAKVYEEYFKAPAISPMNPMRMYGDQLYHSEVRQMLMDYMISPPYYSIPSQSPKWTPTRIMGMTGPGYGPPPGAPTGFFSMSPADYLKQISTREIKQCGDAQPRWDKVWKDAVAAEALVEPSRLPFYRYEMLTMIAINKDSNHILFLISNAVQDAQSGNTAKAKQEAQEALKAFDEIHQLELGGEYGKWKNWFRGDWLTGVDQTRDMVATFVKYLDDPMTTLPPPVNAGGWEGYYHILHYEGNRSVDTK
ncbi:MAG: glycosyl hydrolase 115 family protein [Candidatus Acidiferrales bacterium]